MEGAEEYHTSTLMDDKKRFFLTHKDAEELLAAETETQSLTALRGGERTAQVRATRRVLASTAVQNVPTCPTFS